MFWQTHESGELDFARRTYSGGLTQERFVGYLRRFAADERGFVGSAEAILVATIAVIGLLVGLAALRDGLVSELSDVAGAIQDVNMSYSYDGAVGHSASTAGSDFDDELDRCDSADDPANVIDNCVSVLLPPEDEFVEEMDEF